MSCTSDECDGMGAWDNGHRLTKYLQRTCSPPPYRNVLYQINAPTNNALLLSQRTLVTRGRDTGSPVIVFTWCFLTSGPIASHCVRREQAITSPCALADGGQLYQLFWVNGSLRGDDPEKDRIRRRHKPPYAFELSADPLLLEMAGARRRRAVCSDLNDRSSGGKRDENAVDGCSRSSSTWMSSVEKVDDGRTDVRGLRGKARDPKLRARDVAAQNQGRMSKMISVTDLESRNCFHGTWTQCQPRTIISTAWMMKLRRCIIWPEDDGIGHVHRPQIKFETATSPPKAFERALSCPSARDGRSFISSRPTTNQPTLDADARHCIVRNNPPLASRPARKTGGNVTLD
ncbi:hypothetical protein EV363DRAFT_1301259 [Boletus edulis]|nr:hypothetical protein EV363DRAFT_1301259 [Boletus edulis]